MAMSKKIKILLVERDMTQTDLASKLNITGATLSDKMKRDNFSEKDLTEIAKILNCDFKGIFIMKDTGKEI